MVSHIVRFNLLKSKKQVKILLPALMEFLNYIDSKILLNLALGLIA